MKLAINKQKTFLSIIVIALFDLPRYFIELFSLPVPYYFGGNPPWLMPIILISLFYFLLKSNFKIKIKTEDFLMIFTIFGWLLLYLYHDDYKEGGWESWYGASLITTNIWMYCGYLLLKTRSHLDGFYEDLMNITISVLSILAGIILLLILFNYFYLTPIYEKLQNNNSLAIWQVFCLLLTLFFTKSYSYTTKLIIIILSCFLIFYSNSRGCIAIALIILSYKFLTVLEPKVFRQLVFISICLSLIVLSVVISEFIANQLSLMTKGLNLFDRNYTHAEGYSLDSDIISAYSRIKTNLLMLDEFIKNPIFGIGFQSSKQLTSFGYISHTYYLFPLTSYGFLGSLFHIIFFVYFFIKGLKWNLHATIISFMLIILIFTISNDMLAWLAILLIFLNKKKDVQRKSIKKQSNKYVETQINTGNN